MAPRKPEPLLMQIGKHIIINYNFLITIFLVPISLLYDFYEFVSFRLHTLLSDTAVGHEEGVRRVQQQVKEWARSGSKQFMATARPAHKSISLQKLLYKNTIHKIKIDLPNIVKLDEKNKIVRVEPMVTIGLLNDYLIKKGWTLPVVPELDDLTIGGLVMGCGLETTSVKYGLFESVCQAYELVLSDASTIWCSRTENLDLFEAMPLSYGTLGFLTAVDLEIVPFKPYVRLTYIPTKSEDDMIKVLTDLCDDEDREIVEGIIYSKDTAVLMKGHFVDSLGDDGPLERHGRWYKEWFFKHARGYLDKDDKVDTMVEYIPTNDYYHRHNKSVFWLMQYMLSGSGHPIIRYLLGWAFPIKFSLGKLFLSYLGPLGEDESFITQDYVVRLKEVKELLAIGRKHFKIYPIWVCPTLPTGDMESVHGEFLPARSTMYIDIGYYGFSADPHFDRDLAIETTEDFCQKNFGFAALYSDTHLSKDQLYSMFHYFMKKYDYARKKYKCEHAFPHLYDKVSIAARG